MKEFPWQSFPSLLHVTLHFSLVNRQYKVRNIFVHNWVGNHIRSAPTREGTAAGRRMENELSCMLLQSRLQEPAWCRSNAQPFHVNGRSTFPLISKPNLWPLEVKGGWGGASVIYHHHQDDVEVLSSMVDDQLSVVCSCCDLPREGGWLRELSGPQLPPAPLLMWNSLTDWTNPNPDPSRVACAF